MLILGIDTSDKNVNISITENEDVLYEIEVITKRTEDITNLIDIAFKQINKEASDLKGIGVITGPGGYTGVRTGVAVAKTLSQFIDIPIIGFNKIEAILLSYPEKKQISVNLDVKRDESYFCIANIIDSKIIYEKEPVAIKFEEVLNYVKERKDTTFILNDFKSKKELFEQFENVDFDFYLKPSYLAILTYKAILDGKGKRFNDIEPFYIRTAI
ncbi:MAG: tRNA (adenosine(37)-N6)-threonylcarbamoyltransferase complex dimerization subunit type 1 TsaB [Cyanobacteriota bacterium]